MTASDAIKAKIQVHHHHQSLRVKVACMVLKHKTFVLKRTACKKNHLRYLSQYILMVKEKFCSLF